MSGAGKRNLNIASGKREIPQSPRPHVRESPAAADASTRDVLANANRNPDKSLWVQARPTRATLRLFTSLNALDRYIATGGPVLLRIHNYLS
jgi:hypothetical protein